MPKLAFAGQRANEKVLFVFRRHIIAMRKGFYGFLIAFLVGSIPFLIWSSNVNLLFGTLIGLIVGIFILFYQWMGWYFSVFIVTNQRIRQLVQNSFFGHSVIDLNLAKVQNCSYRIPGFTGEIFGFGTIILQTIVGDMVMNKIPKTEEIYAKLQDAIVAAGGKIDAILEDFAAENNESEVENGAKN